jgi:Domain of unknown function (DUF4062)
MEHNRVGGLIGSQCQILPRSYFHRLFPQAAGVCLEMSEVTTISRKVVMISSTALDLPKHREQARLACEQAGFAPHDMMEHLPARNADAIEASLQMVEHADVYVGIFAQRYGYVPDGHEISITEMEYNRAVTLKKPRLTFFNHEDHEFKSKDFETGPGAAKLQSLKARIGKDRVAAFFKSADDLRGHVFAALTSLAKELDRPNRINSPSIPTCDESVSRRISGLRNGQGPLRRPRSRIGTPRRLVLGQNSRSPHAGYGSGWSRQERLAGSMDGVSSRSRSGGYGWMATRLYAHQHSRRHKPT